MGERSGSGASGRRAAGLMDDDEDDPGLVCAACGCSVCRLAEAFADCARRPAQASGPTAALPGPRLARYPLPSS